MFNVGLMKNVYSYAAGLAELGCCPVCSAAVAALES